VSLNIQSRQKTASVIVRARQVIPALAANQLATLRFEPFGTNRAETDGVLRSEFPLAGARAKRARIRFYMQASFHGPKVIA
jgi:hypothetical protein